MKKDFAIILALIMMLTNIACGYNDEPEPMIEQPVQEEIIQEIEPPSIDKNAGLIADIDDIIYATMGDTVIRTEWDDKACKYWVFVATEGNYHVVNTENFRVMCEQLDVLSATIFELGVSNIICVVSSANYDQVLYASEDGTDITWMLESNDGRIATPI